MTTPPLVSMSTKAYCLTQREWKNCLWKPSEILDDETLRRGGQKLAGWGRDASALSDDEYRELLRMLSVGDEQLSNEEKVRLRDLHERTPYTHHRIPFLDFDVATEHPDFTRERAINLAIVHARAMTEACQEFGLGTPAWAISNLNGGMHGRLKLPELRPSPVLPFAVLELVREAARSCEVPLLSQTPSMKDRPIVGLDDNLFNRKVTARGGMWRVAGVPKPGKDKVYIPVEIPDAGLPRSLGHVWPEPIPGDAQVLLAEIERQETLASKQKAEERELRARAQAYRADALRRQAEASARGETIHGTAWPFKYVEAAVSRQIDKMHTASKGGRNPTLNQAAYYFGGLEAGGAFAEHPTLTPAVVREQLVQAAIAVGGHTEEHIRSVAEIGWRNGLAFPVLPPPPLPARRKETREATAPTQESAPAALEINKVLRAELAWLEALRPTADILRAREKPPLDNHRRHEDGSPSTGETNLALSGWVCRSRIHATLAATALDVLGVTGAASLVQGTYERIMKNEPVRGVKALDALLTAAGFGKREGAAWRGALLQLQKAQVDFQLAPPTESEERKAARLQRRGRNDLVEDEVKATTAQSLDPNAEKLDPLILKGLKRTHRFSSCREVLLKQACARGRSYCQTESQARKANTRYKQHVPCNDRLCPEDRAQDRGARARYAIMAATATMQTYRDDGRDQLKVYSVTIWLDDRISDPGDHAALVDFLHSGWANHNDTAAHVVPGCVVALTCEKRSSTDDGYGKALDNPVSHLSVVKDLMRPATRARFGIRNVVASNGTRSLRDAVRNSFEAPNKALDRYYSSILNILPGWRLSTPDEHKAAVEKFLLTLGEDPWHKHRFALYRGKLAYDLLPLPSKAALRDQRQRDADASAGLVDGPEAECECGAPLLWDAYDHDGVVLLASGLEHPLTIDQARELHLKSGFPMWVNRLKTVDGRTEPQRL